MSQVRAITFEQASPASVWTVTHAFTSTPVVDVLVSVNGLLTKILPQSITNPSDTQIVITFSSAESGVARLVGDTGITSSGISGAGSIDPGMGPIIT